MSAVAAARVNRTGPSTRSRLVMGSGRELGSVGLVAGLCGAYAGVLLMVSSFLTTMAAESSAGLAFFLGAVTSVFVGIALYVATIVIANAVSTVLAGRVQHLALLRLLGSESRDLRRSIRNTTARVGLIGAIVGTLVGVVLSALGRLILMRRGTMPHVDYALVRPGLLVAIAAIVAASLLAGWLGSRTVLSVSPAQAMSGSFADVPESRRTSRLRATFAALLLAGGGGLLTLGMTLGEDASDAGFLVAFLGAAVFGTGLLVGARLVIPGAVVSFSRLLGVSPTARIARRNALKDPERTTRSTMGLVIGVCLITTFASGFAALRTSVLAIPGLTPEDVVQVERVLAMTATILICIVLISSVIAAVGFSTTMTLTVIQRRREIGLLRALGFTSHQVRSMITLESVALSASAVLLGVALGVFFGSAGSQSLVGSVTDGFVWGLPWAWLVAIAAVGAVLVLGTSHVAARRAVETSPIEALAQD